MAFWICRRSERHIWFWLSTVNASGAGTRVMVTDDYGNLVVINYTALAASVANSEHGTRP